jgi:hypothetical protein
MPGPTARSRDTSPALPAQQIERYRAMSPSRELELTFELCAAVDALLAAGIRRRRPAIDESSRREEMLRLKYGRQGG